MTPNLKRRNELKLKRLNRLKYRPEFFVKVKGDAGRYNIWAIDYLNLRINIWRASTYEWIDFDRITIVKDKK